MNETGSELIIPIFGWPVDANIWGREQGIECWTPLKPCTDTSQTQRTAHTKKKICNHANDHEAHGSPVHGPIRSAWKGVLDTLRTKKAGKRCKHRQATQSDGNDTVATEESEQDNYSSTRSVATRQMNSSSSPTTKPSAINIVETFCCRNGIEIECVLASAMVLSTRDSTKLLTQVSSISKSETATSKLSVIKKERRGRVVDAWSMAKRGDVMALRRLDETDHIDWTERDCFDNPPLYYACHVGAALDIESVRFLLHVWPLPALPDDLLARCRRNAANAQVLQMLDHASFIHSVYLSDMDEDSEVSSSSSSSTEVSAWYDMFDMDDDMGDLEDYIIVSKAESTLSKLTVDNQETKVGVIDAWALAKIGDTAGLRELDAKYDIDWTARDRFDSPPLYYACHSGAAVDIESVRFLLHIWPHSAMPDEVFARCRKNAINAQVTRMLDNANFDRDVHVSDEDPDNEVSSSSSSSTEVAPWYNMFDMDDNFGDLGDY